MTRDANRRLPQATTLILSSLLFVIDDANGQRSRRNRFILGMGSLPKGGKAFGGGDYFIHFVIKYVTELLFAHSKQAHREDDSREYGFLTQIVTIEATSPCIDLSDTAINSRESKLDPKL